MGKNGNPMSCKNNKHLLTFKILEKNEVAPKSIRVT